MIFKGLSVAKDCLRPESAPLITSCHNKFNGYACNKAHH